MSKMYHVDYDRNDGRPGYVYVLHNEAMREGIYKIGQTTRSGAHRARELNMTVGTETPKMFKCIFQFATVDCGRAEKAIHKILDPHRLTRQEYFEVDLEFAKQIIIQECSKQIPDENEQRRNATQKRGNSGVVAADQKRRIERQVSKAQTEWRLSAIHRIKLNGRNQSILLGFTLLSFSVAGFSVIGLSINTCWWMSLAIGFCTFSMRQKSIVSEYLAGQEATAALEKIAFDIRSEGSAENKTITISEVTTSDPKMNKIEKIPELQQSSERQASFIENNIPVDPDHFTGPVGPDLKQINEILREAFDDTVKRVATGERILRIAPELTHEQAVKCGLAARLKLISFAHTKKGRAEWEENIVAMIQNSYPLIVTDQQALGICRLLEGELRLQYGWGNEPAALEKFNPLDYASAKMSPDDMRQTLFTSDITGLPNARAFDEFIQDNPAASVAMFDAVETLKAQFGRAGATQMLKLIGDLYAQAADALGVSVFHKYGDVFLAAHVDRATLEAFAKEVQYRLANAQFLMTTEGGEISIFKGVQYCFGVGKDARQAELAWHVQEGQNVKPPNSAPAPETMAGFLKKLPPGSKITKVTIPTK